MKHQSIKKRHSLDCTDQELDEFYDVICKHLMHLNVMNSVTHTEFIRECRQSYDLTAIDFYILEDLFRINRYLLKVFINLDNNIVRNIEFSIFYTSPQPEVSVILSLIISLLKEYPMHEISIVGNFSHMPDNLRQALKLLGFHEAYASLVMDLNLEDFKRLADAKNNWSIEVLDGLLPFELYGTICAFYNQMSEAIPKSVTPPQKYTPEILAKLECEFNISGFDRIIALLFDRIKSQYIGFTEIYLASSEDVARQENTYIAPDERRLGAGKYLKTYSICATKQKWPRVQSIRTTTSLDNLPMLSLNRWLGFKEIGCKYFWLIR